MSKICLRHFREISTEITRHVQDFSRMYPGTILSKICMDSLLPCLQTEAMTWSWQTASYAPSGVRLLCMYVSGNNSVNSLGHFQDIFMTFLGVFDDMFKKLPGYFLDFSTTLLEHFHNLSKHFLAGSSSKHFWEKGSTCSTCPSLSYLLMLFYIFITFPRHVHDKFKTFPIIFPGNYREMSWTFPEHVQQFF